MIAFAFCCGSNLRLKHSLELSVLHRLILNMHYRQCFFQKKVFAIRIISVPKIVNIISEFPSTSVCFLVTRCSLYMNANLFECYFFRQKLRLQVSQLKRGSHLRRTFLAKALLILSGNNTRMLWPTPSGVTTSALATKVRCCIGDWRAASNLIP